MKRDNIAWNIIIILLSVYGVAIYKNPAVELERPIIYVFFPCVLLCVTTSLVASRTTQIPVLKSLRYGIMIGIAVSLTLFLSNFAVSKPFNGSYVVLKVTAGRSASVHWTIRTPESDNVVLFISVKGITALTNPNDVDLKLSKGWIGFYFGSAKLMRLG